MESNYLLEVYEVKKRVDTCDRHQVSLCAYIACPSLEIAKAWSELNGYEGAEVRSYAVL